MPQDFTPIDLRHIQVQHKNVGCWPTALGFQQK
jgi:hypothetical protein